MPLFVRILCPQRSHKSTIIFDLWTQWGYKKSMKTDLIKLRVTPAEKDGFQQAADIAGIALSAWVRERLRAAARRELVESGKQVPFLVDRGGG